MKLKQYQGFTLVEITLFLAISGLLLLIVVFGMGPQLKQSEFTDSMQGIGSYINGQYNDIQTGVNERNTDISCSTSGDDKTVKVQASATGDKAGTSKNCVLLGRYFEFKDSGTGINAHDVVGAVQNNACTSSSSDNLYSKLESACATSVSGSINTAKNYEFGWGNKLQHSIGGLGGRVLKGTTTLFNDDAGSAYYSANAFGIYRNPDSGKIFVVIYQKGDDGAGHSIEVALPTNNINAQFCFMGQAPYPGAIYFGGNYKNGTDTVSGGNNLVSVKVDDDSCNSWKPGVSYHP